MIVYSNGMGDKEMLEFADEGAIGYLSMEEEKPRRKKRSWLLEVKMLTGS